MLMVTLFVQSGRAEVPVQSDYRGHTHMHVQSKGNTSI